MGYINNFITLMITIGIFSIPVSMLKEYLQVSYEHNKSNRVDKKLN